MWTEGRIDMTKLIIAFRNFANAPKNLLFYIRRAHLTRTGHSSDPRRNHFVCMLHMGYFAYDFLYLVFVFVIMSGGSKIKSES